MKFHRPRQLFGPNKKWRGPYCRRGVDEMLISLSAAVSS